MVCSFRYAEQVSINDDILVYGNDNMIPANVINISNFSMQGNLYSQT